MKYLLLIALCVASLSVSAQQFSEPCGTMPMLEEQLKNDPGLAERMAKAEERIQQFIARNKGSRSAANVITIPVVFHIVHNGQPVGTGSNISEAQVLSQLEIMNEDFQRLNADTVKLRSIFKAVAGNPKIEFCMATVAPDGSPTDGINRVDGGRGEWPRADIQDDLKPSTVWDSRLYLNFWVVDFGPSSNLLGYAQFPGGSPLTDGIVVGYQYIGEPPHNPVPNSYNYGRTATHEIGHWLNLRHIWGDGPCSEDDFVDDTPRAEDSNYECPIGINSCTEMPVDLPDMVENYMDYSRDTCMNTFTKGQVDRMRAAINAERSGLLTSPGCSNAASFAFSGKVVDTTTGLGVPFAKVVFKGLFTYPVEADTAGEFALPYLLEGTYEVFAGSWGYNTAYHSSDTLNASVANYVIGVGKGYYDDFVLDQGWTEDGDAETGSWTRGVPFGTFSNGQPFNPGIDIGGDYGESCFMTGNGGGGSGNDDVDNGQTTLSSPVFDATGYANPKLAFYRWFQVGGGNDPSTDSLIITLHNGAAVDTLEVVTRTSNDLGQWIYREYRIADRITPTDSMRLVLYTADREDSGNLVEAAFDVFQVADSIATIPKPSASFTFETDTICGGESVRFTNTSTNAPNTIQWEFPGGTPSTTTAVNPLITFEDGGDFGATLIVGNAGGFDTLEMTDLIHVYPKPDVTLTLAPILCHGDTNGSLTLSIASGTPPFQILWNTGDTTALLEGLSEGTYVATVTDAKGCGEELINTIVEPSELKGAAASLPDNGTGNGEVLASAIGGTPPYSFQWDDPNNSTTNRVTGLSAGTYSVTITDSRGCQITRTTVVSLAIGIESPEVFSEIMVAPNPASVSVEIRFRYQGQGPIQLAVYNFIGQRLERIVVPALPDVSVQMNVADWPAGVYMIELSDGKGELKIPLVKTE